MKKTATLLILGIWIILVFGVLVLPEFGSYPNKEHSIEGTSTYYLEKGVSQTGALNMVSAVVWDYRGYDTLGEVTVLFTAVCGVVAILRKRGEP